MRAIICGGGTGGHIYPALSIAVGLERSGWQVLYMGSRDSAEQRLAAQSGFAFRGVSACGLHKRSPRLLADLRVNLRGRREALSVLREFGPDVVVGTGGYASAPVVLAAQKLHIPTLLHEQNAFPGLANRVLARRADRVCLTFAAAESSFPHTERLCLTGLPVRASILSCGKQQALDFFRLPPSEADVFTLLVTGGSQGAAVLNKAMLTAYQPLLDAGLRIIHICGPEHMFAQKQQAPLHPRLLLYPYLDGMENALALADLACARAGASFLSEAACLGLPTLLAPYPLAANDHQRCNARAFAAAGAAEMIEDADLTGALLSAKVLALAADRERLAQMSAAARTLAVPDATQRILDAVTQVISARTAG